MLVFYLLRRFLFSPSIHSFFFYVYAIQGGETFKFYPITTATVLLKTFQDICLCPFHIFFFLSLDIISLHENRENVSSSQDVDAQISTWVAEVTTVSNHGFSDSEGHTESTLSDIN